MNKIPQSLRTHIGFFGRCNVGKSSLINALTGQSIAIVSDVAGTTTDAVVKSMEIGSLGACVVIDTAGFDDGGVLGEKRLEQTLRASERCDMAVVVCGASEEYDLEREWLRRFAERKVPTLVVLGKTDMLIDPEQRADSVERELGIRPLLVSAVAGEGIAELVDALVRLQPEGGAELTITGGLVSAGDTVVMVMPQDGSAPKGRLIMPQVQTLRELLDLRATAVCCQPEELEQTLAGLAKAPRLIITDSQVFGYVAERVPEGSLLTSFSVLMACYKGDGEKFAEGAKSIDCLTEQSRVLIAEACTHAPASEDIGRVKLPMMLRRKVGAGLTVDVVGGADFPSDLTPYDLVIHCGACMFTRAHVLSRLARAESQGIPMTNYGMAIAHLQGILGKVTLPKDI
ncbi:MAG: [FeFe] hydrogenase H-cluster maturation GTPase HydF [Tidjanibacter sp.]|nr:[FeFe] hydrogenase H-cluster maturation GTPase HydF [Tidjanibacter sp.]